MNNDVFQNITTNLKLRKYKVIKRKERPEKEHWESNFEFYLGKVLYVPIEIWFIISSLIRPYIID